MNPRNPAKSNNKNTRELNRLSNSFLVGRSLDKTIELSTENPQVPWFKSKSSQSLNPSCHRTKMIDPPCPDPTSPLNQPYILGSLTYSSLLLELMFHISLNFFCWEQGKTPVQAGLNYKVIYYHSRQNCSTVCQSSRSTSLHCSQ